MIEVSKVGRGYNALSLTVLAKSMPNNLRPCATLGAMIRRLVGTLLDELGCLRDVSTCKVTSFVI